MYQHVACQAQLQVTYPIHALDCFVVSTWDLDILDYGEGKLAGVFLVGLFDLLGP